MASAPPASSQRATPAPVQPRSLIVTVYGLYARDEAGWIGIATLIRMLAEIGVDEQAVRSSVSRLKRRGFLESARVDGVAGYALTAATRQLLDDGDHRIFHRPRARLADGWLLAVFSVPESERTKRHLLRSRLSWLGFGTVSAGVWIAPAQLEQEARDVLSRYALSTYVDLFHGDHLGFGELRIEIERWWDLASLQQMYDDFTAAYRPLLATWVAGQGSADGQAFADYVRALTAWRRLPYLDPGLPDEVLPAGWRGSSAGDLFAALRERLAPAAQAYVSTLIPATGRSQPVSENRRDADQ